MIPRTHRLVISSSHPFLGTKRRGEWCLIISNQAELPQWTVAVGKKIDNRAVVRNRLRRQISQWLYLHVNELKPQQFLIIPRHKPTNRDELNALFEEIKKQVWKLDQLEIGN